MHLGLISRILGALVLAAVSRPAASQEAKPLKIGVNTAIQLQVGRDAIDGAKMAIAEINAQGGVLGRKLEIVFADESEAASEGPKVGIAAVSKLNR
jgi:branched-chain amino acid transport system substrate-binding protein